MYSITEKSFKTYSELVIVLYYIILVLYPRNQPFLLFVAFWIIYFVELVVEMIYLSK